MGPRSGSGRPPTGKYRIMYSSEAEGHLRALTARQRAMVLDAVEEQLSFEPARETRNRKRMRDNPVAPWRLRIGDLRVYYDVDSVAEHVVFVLAVGIKIGSQVHIGGEVVEL